MRLDPSLAAAPDGFGVAVLKERSWPGWQSEWGKFLDMVKVGDVRIEGFFYERVIMLNASLKQANVFHMKDNNQLCFIGSREDKEKMLNNSEIWVSNGAAALYNCISAVRRSQPALPSSMCRELLLLAGLFQQQFTSGWSIVSLQHLVRTPALSPSAPRNLPRVNWGPLFKTNHCTYFHNLFPFKFSNLTTS